jgi:Arc/MetJ-type ribon-helix-helix transcriptional regulator
MVSLNIPLSAADKDFIDRQVAVGGFRDTAAYILSLVEADRSRQVRAEVEEKIREGLGSPTALMPDQEWDEIRQLGEQILHEKKAR